MLFLLLIEIFRIINHSKGKYKELYMKLYTMEKDNLKFRYMWCASVTLGFFFLFSDGGFGPISGYRSQRQALRMVSNADVGGAVGDGV